MTDAAATPAIPHDHTPSTFGGVERNEDGTIKGWEFHEAESPSREERINALLASMEHAMMHNAPVTAVMLQEAKDLLTAPAA